MTDADKSASEGAEMDGEHLAVGPAPERNWKRTLGQRKVWAPAAAGVVVLGVVVAAVTNAGVAEPSTSPLASAAPTASGSVEPTSPSTAHSESPAPSASTSALPSPTASDSAAHSQNPSPTPSISPSARPAGFVMPDDSSSAWVLFTPNSGETYVVGPSEDDGFMAVVSWEHEAGPTFWLVDLALGNGVKEFESNRAAGAMAWMPTGSTALIAINTGSTTALRRVDAATGEWETLARISYSYATSVDIAPDESRALVSVCNKEPWQCDDIADFSVIEVRLDTGKQKKLATGFGAVYTPTGDAIFYTAASGAGMGLWKMQPDGAKAQAASTNTFRSIKPITWSPDGSLGVYTARSDSGSLMAITPDGRREEVIASGADSYRDIGFSPDGSRILFRARHGETFVEVRDRVGHVVLHATPKDLGAKGDISAAAWLPGGSGIVVGTTNGKQGSSTLRVSLDGSPQPIVAFGTSYLDAPPAWSRDGQYSVWPVTDYHGLDPEVWWFSSE